MQRSEPAGRFDVVVAALAGLAAVVLVMGTLAVEQIRVTHEIQLWAPSRAQVGDRAPFRARVFADLDAPQGPRLVTSTTTVGLYADDEAWDQEGLGDAELDVAAFDTLEGSALTERGSTRVLAIVREGQVLATAERAIAVSDVVTERLPIRARLGDALQVLSLARPPAVMEAAPDLDVAVEGGVCVPERSCRLVFLRGAHLIVPRLFECVGLDVGATDVGTELVTVSVVVHGSEARCELGLDPLEITTVLQVPVGLATPFLEAEHEDDVIRVHGEPPIGRDEMFLDVFVGERWVGAHTMQRDARLELRLDDVGSGLVRLQARADLDSSERAYQLALLARHPRLPAAVETAALRTRFGEGAATWSSERRRWAMLELEADLVDVEAPTSGLARDEARLASLRTTMRSICAGGVLLGVIAILVMVMRRGLASAKEAREVLLEAGDETADDARARWRSWLTVTGFVAAIGLAILLGAAFLVARPLFMG
ncbi:MAG: hypothetical protein J0L92_20025 [Deltaproteobacteria bacterium]|nr:hypothetical protein [Deltaproteobacteria bacterium]